MPIIFGPEAVICDECVNLCVEILYGPDKSTPAPEGAPRGLSL
jgi:hypothetical protein